MRSLTLIAVLTLLAPGPAYGRPPRAAQVARDDALGEFTTLVAKYLALRADLEKGLPALTGSDDPDQVRTVETTLAARIREARARAKQGDLFTADASAAFRKILHQLDAATWKAIMDHNPGRFPNRVNDSYPKTKPLSTVPPNLLARLPPLPEGLQYRFVGADLILHDTKANVIVDRLPEAIPVVRPPRDQLRAVSLAPLTAVCPSVIALKTMVRTQQATIVMNTPFQPHTSAIQPTPLPAIADPKT